MADTRKDRRAPVSLKVRFKSATVDEFVEQYAVDVSRGGIFIKSKSPMSIGTLLKFEFQLKDESRLIHGVGRVVWKREGTAGGEEKPPGMGIKFIKMDPQSRALVEKISAQRGDAPGEFEQGRGRPRSAKKTEMFFPAPTPMNELPAPEDSTQVRHASEFLAEALSAGDEDAAKEAAENAEKARKRTEEIAQERAAAAQAAKDAEKAAATEAAEQAAAEKAAQKAAEEAADKAAEEKAAEEKAAAEKAAADEAAEEQAADAPAEPAAREEDAAASADAGEDGRDEKPEPGSKDAEAPADAAGDDTTDEAQAAKGDDGEKAEADDQAGAERAEREAAEKSAARRQDEEDEAKKAAGAAKSPSRRPKAAAVPPEEPRSMMLPVLVGLVAILGLAYFFVTQNNAGDRAGGDEPLANVGAEPTTNEVPDVVPEPPPELPPAVDPGQGDGVDVPALGALADGEPSAAEDQVMVSVRITSTPAGAAVEIGGLAAGETPFSTEMPVGETAEIVVRQDGYVTGRETVTPTEDQRPIAVTLEPMPYVIIANVSPSDARVVSGGREADESGAITLARAPRGPVTVNAYQGGFTSGSAQVLRGSFVADGERMVARVSITLERRTAASRPAMARPAMTATMATADPAPTMADPAPTMADPAPTTADPVPTMADPAPPTPDPTPTMADPPPPTMTAPAEVPDNPF